MCMRIVAPQSCRTTSREQQGVVFLHSALAAAGAKWLSLRSPIHSNNYYLVATVYYFLWSEFEYFAYTFIASRHAPTFYFQTLIMD